MDRWIEKILAHYAENAKNPLYALVGLVL